MTSVPPLPPPQENQEYCDVSALEGGLLNTPCHMFVSTAPEGERIIAPSLSFLITHRATGTRIVFDLGIRSDIQNYPELTRRRLSDVYQASAPVDVPTALAKGDLKPEDITHVCLSHCQLFQPGYPEDPKSVFPADLLPKERTDFLDVTTEAWKPIGPFPRANDYFGDGSLYLIDSPGHLPGHLNLLARTSADGGWIYLAGDAAHDWRLVRGEGDIAMYPAADGGMTCIHVNKEQAKTTIKRIADVLMLPRVRVILAHDAEWFDQNKGGDAFWPGKISSLDEQACSDRAS